MNKLKSKTIFNISATLEIIIGMCLIIAPKFTIHSLLGDGITLVGLSVTIVAGIALISLGISALELFNQPIKQFTRLGLLIYNFGAVILFLVLTTVFSMNGALIWPTIVLHLIIFLIMCNSFWRLYRN